MKIVLIYRQPHIEAYSIEELFRAIGTEMSKHAQIIQYTTGGLSKIFIDAWRLRSLNADVYHITGGINYMACLLPRRKTVLTMHDIVHFMYTLKGYKRFIYKYLWLILPIKLAAKVTAISLATAEKIAGNLGIKKNIAIIPNCYNPIFKPVSKEFNTAYPTIFQIGTLPHKNLPRLIEALKEIKCRLILIGRLETHTIQLLKQYQITYENYLGITLEEIYQHYINCDIVSFISLHEGFGVPIIEAQVVGRPVITSNYAPMNIVAGNGARLVDPMNVEEIKDGLVKIINDIKYREELVANGFENVANYSVSAISRHYLDLYKSLPNKSII
jgi:glycosyltransferase involved in cell wall biosynthesis